MMDMPLPEPLDYCYEWDGPYGSRKFSAALHNGRPPDRSVAIYSADQLRARDAQWRAIVATEVAKERENLRAALAAQPAEAQQEPVAWQEEALGGWKEATIGWSVCASVHLEWAKGKDGVFKTRQADFVRHENDARSKYTALSAAQPVPAAVPPGMALVPIEPTPGIITTGTVALMKASDSDLDATREEIAATYRAMIAAAGDKP